MISADDVAHWRAYLAEWETTVYKPIFEPRRISRDAALIAWATWAKPFPTISSGGGL